MRFPVARPRRLRRTPALRRLVRETAVRADDLVLPLFVVPGRSVADEIEAMPGCFHYSVDRLVPAALRARDAGVGAVLLFGQPERKDARGSSAWARDAVVPRAVRALKRAAPELLVMTDVCLCAYTSHGHCGVLEGDDVANDASLELLGRMALAHAEAGADVVAPSDMMDGRVGSLRRDLDGAGHEGVALMSYAVKYASGFYGPFREAADSAPSRGDRAGYQMDPANVREALREVALDVDEGADIVMVKPALAYLDVVARVRAATTLPLAAYNVSGEYSMIKAAAARGWVDERRVASEVLTAMRRAGADILITYFAVEAAGWFATPGA